LRGFFSMFRTWRNASEWNIYALRDPETQLIRYVGCTKLPLSKRLEAHLATAQPSGWMISRKDHWLVGLKARKLQPTIELLQVVRSEPLAAERAWIKGMRSIGCDLTNGVGPIDVNALPPDDPAIKPTPKRKRRPRVA
jgi:hypothetical protein